MNMERTALKQLIAWKNNEKRKPLILWGARQVGKTYLVKDMFAEEQYPGKYVYIDFRVESTTRSFCSNTVNAKEIIEFISASKNIKINKDTLLIFDEIQECPAIITALKYFCQDCREIPVIATGSMVRIRLNRLANKRGGKSEQFLFPVGKINQLTLYPISYDEFLLNYNKVLYNHIAESYSQKQALGEEYHKLAMDSVYKYLLIGGMPEAVEAFIETGSFYDSREILKELYDNYLSDMQLYQASPESIIRSRKVFEGIYKELTKESKNFSPSLLEEKAKNREFTTPIDWLTTAHIVNKSYQLKEHITSPLIEDNAGNFRLYLGDIGMFSYQSGINSGTFIAGDNDNTLSGVFFENFIANELISKGIKLFYWKGKSSSELEFIIDVGGRIIPIDVKKSHGNLNSLEKFRNLNKTDIAIKVSKNNFGYNEEKKLLTIPFYYFPFAASDISIGKELVP